MRAIGVLVKAALCAGAGGILCLSCAGGPSDDEIVIRAEDFASRETCPEEARDSLHPDTVAHAAIPDSLELARPDSLAEDSLRELAAADSTADSLAADTVETLPQTPSDWHAVAMEIRGSLYSSLERHVDSQADVLGAHCMRCMWWDIRPWEDLIAGDSLYIVYTDSAQTGFENRILALEYVPVQGSSSPRFAVYRYMRSGDNHPSFYYADGTEAPALLDAMPVTTFEEITGVFGEPRSGHSHAGVDFKAPVGTPVRTVSGGTVSRVDWNSEYNGRCVEVNVGGGYSQVFIHLDGLADGVAPGARIPSGGLVGYVGNTGRSYAAHLHYQINDLSSGYPVDPYIFHGSHRRSLTDGDMEGFREFQSRCEMLMESKRDE